MRGDSANDIAEAIREKRDMPFLSCLSATEIQSMATFLGSSKPGGGNSDGEGGGGPS